MENFFNPHVLHEPTKSELDTSAVSESKVPKIEKCLYKLIQKVSRGRYPKKPWYKPSKKSPEKMLNVVEVVMSTVQSESDISDRVWSEEDADNLDLKSSIIQE